MDFALDLIYAIRFAVRGTRAGRNRDRSLLYTVIPAFASTSDISWIQAPLGSLQYPPLAKRLDTSWLGLGQHGSWCDRQELETRIPVSLDVTTTKKVQLHLSDVRSLRSKETGFDFFFPDREHVILIYV